MTPLKAALKRGALIAAANWQVTLIQSLADSFFKLLIAVPVIGGVFLGALVIGGEPTDIISLEWREMLATIVSALLAQPLVLAAFLAALGIVIVGGSTFVFLVKAGTVAVLVASDQHAGQIEQPPLYAAMLRRACRFSPEFFIDACARLFPRFARLGFALMAVYLISATAYLSVVVTGRVTGAGWGATALLTVAFVAWITIVNLLYLLMQIVIAADDCSVGSAVRRVAIFLRHEIRAISGVFVVVLALVLCATGVSILAAAALGLIQFVPFVGLAVLPMQLVAWLLRGVVFQYLGLTSLGAYLKLYREFRSTLATRPERAEAWRPVHSQS